MKQRPLGGSGLSVSEIGFGCWGIGGVTEGATSYGKTDDDTSRKALETAWQKGIRFFDTSDLYGYGKSEELLGETFASRRKDLIIASKVGFLRHGGPQDFSADYIRASIEKSLNRLRSTYIDLYQLHSPAFSELQSSPETLQTLADLRQQGLIKAIGISVRSPEEGLACIREFDIDAIQVNFNLTDQRAREAGLFKECNARGIGIIVRTPLCFGFLTGKYKPQDSFRADDHRSTWSEEQRRVWSNACHLFTTAVAERTHQTLAQVALRFCLSYPEVSTVIPGMLNPAQVEENVQAGDLGPFTPGDLEKIESLYQNNSFFIRRK